MTVGAALVLLAACLTASAQQRAEPRIGYIFPAGGQQGACLEVAIGGQDLDGASAARLLGGGVACQVTRHLKILNPGQLNALRNEIERLIALEAAATNAATAHVAVTNAAAARATVETLRARIWTTLKSAGIEELSLHAVQEYRRKYSDPKRQPNPALSEIVYARMTIAPDATPGRKDLRLKTAGGLTNPLGFHVGTWAEHVEEEPKGRRARLGPNLTLPIVLNGQIMPGDVDSFPFAAREGERIVAAVSARALIPYLADSVPGWFQATLRLRDAQGKELAYADDFRFNPDPVLRFDIPRDGSYVLEIADALYRGREDFVYRVALGACPYVTGVFPLGGRAGERVPVALEGWNLSDRRATVDLAGREPGPVPDGVPQVEEALDPLPFDAAALSGTSESEPNNDPTHAQAIAPPCIVDGRIGEPGDTDLFRIEGRAGDEIVAEIVARRLNSPLDSVLSLSDPAGRLLATNDDWDDKAAGLVTHQADSRLAVTLRTNGTHVLRVADSQRKGGLAHAYRLRVGPPQPDFELRVVPSAINVRPGGVALFTVFALRRDGFGGDIALSLKNPPAGYSLAGAWVPAGQDKARLTLSAPPSVPPSASGEPAVLVLEGRATIAGRERVRRAVPAEDMMQAFFYRHLVPARGGWLAALAERGGGRGLRATLLTREPVRLPTNGTVAVRYNLRQAATNQNPQVTLDDPPPGLRVAKTAVLRGGIEIVLEAQTPTNAPPKEALASKGNLIFSVAVERTPRPREGQPPPAKTMVQLGLLPAVRYER
jgi:hypothetical protein